MREAVGFLDVRYGADLVAEGLADFGAEAVDLGQLTGLQELHLGGKKLMRCLDLFTDRVIPEVRKASAPAASV